MGEGCVYQGNMKALSHAWLRSTVLARGAFLAALVLEAASRGVCVSCGEGVFGEGCVPSTPESSNFCVFSITLLTAKHVGKGLQCHYGNVELKGDLGRGGTGIKRRSLAGDRGDGGRGSGPPCGGEPQ
jgi:hypothetical protein